MKHLSNSWIKLGLLSSIAALIALMSHRLEPFAQVSQASVVGSGEMRMAQAPAVPSQSPGVAEARTLLTIAARESGRPSYSPQTAVKFKPSDNVYVKSALAIDFKPGQATVTLPLFRGLSPQGEDVYYIITEASDFDVAREMGVNFAPKMKNAIGTTGAQTVTLTEGVMQFAGNVDFAPERQVAPGSPYPFPPSMAKPGAIADAQWSSMVVTPSNVVLNVQMVHNASGSHDRLKAIDLEKRTVTLSILDGFQGGRQYFYHLVTDASADVPAVLEQGVFAPKLANVPAFGQSKPGDKSALLGFSPVLNGIIDPGTGQNQGFATSLANGGIDPINIFPIPPSNDDNSAANNYSPLWDAHVNMWTEEAIKTNKVRRITSFEDLEGLVKAGLVTSASINPEGAGNPWLFGLRPTRAIINCPVIAHPILDN
jgi:hypothetical protein